MIVMAFRFAGHKRRLVESLFASADLRFRRFSWPRWSGYPESRARATEALASARSQRRSGWVNAIRRRLFGLQYNYWRRIFEDHLVDAAVIWNGLVSSRRIFMLAARDAGVKTLFLERGPFPETLTADPVGVNFRNSLPRAVAPYLDWLKQHPEADGAWQPLAEKLRQRPAKARHPAGRRPPPPLESPFVFLPLQKQGDTQLRFFGKACTGVPETVAFVAAAAKSLPAGWHIRLKQHPSDKSRFPGLLDGLEDLPLYLDNETETFAQVRASRLVLTVNSSVGLEAMLLGARVAVMGEAFWALPGCVSPATTHEQLAALLSNPEAAVHDEQARNALLSFLVAEYYPRHCVGPDGAISFSPEDRAKILARLQSGYVLADEAAA